MVRLLIRPVAPVGPGPVNPSGQVRPKARSRSDLGPHPGPPTDSPPRPGRPPLRSSQSALLGTTWGDAKRVIVRLGGRRYPESASAGSAGLPRWLSHRLTYSSWVALGLTPAGRWASPGSLVAAGRIRQQRQPSPRVGSLAPQLSRRTVWSYGRSVRRRAELPYSRTHVRSRRIVCHSPGISP